MPAFKGLDEGEKRSAFLEAGMSAALVLHVPPHLA